MNKFAKLFDVADTQVLFMVASDENDDVALKMTTKVNDLDVTQSIVFKGEDQDAMHAKALEVLGALNQESADKFYVQMTDLILGGVEP